MSSSETDDTLSDTDEYEGSYEPVLDEIYIGILHISKGSPKFKNGNANPNSKLVAEKFTNSINKHWLSRVNRLRTTLKGINSGNRTPKVDTWNLAQIWGIGIEWAKKTILKTTQNYVRDVTRPLIKRFRKR